jgi:hypothetical protein
MLKTDALKLLLIVCFAVAPLVAQSGITRPANVIYVANEAGTGTIQGKLVKLTGAPSTAIIAAITDTSGVVGICVNNCGTTSTATIQVWGQVNCAFDSATTAGHYIQIDTSTAGDCMDTGAATPPTSGQSIGRVLSTNGGAGSYSIDLFASEIQAGGGGGGHVIQDEGAPLPAEPDLNFAGAGVTCADDPGNTGTKCTIPGGGGGGHVIQDEGVPLPAEPDLNFAGAGVTCADDPGNTGTKCTIPGGGGGGHVIQDEGVPLPAEPDLNFAGAGVTCADDPGNTGTKCTIPGGTAGAANYSKPFTGAGSLTITNAEHGFGHANLLVNCYDNSTPPQYFEPNLITIDPATYQVVVTFVGTPTGHCVVNGGSGASTAIPEWRKYSLVAIVNGVNGCANANGCWQVNGILGANKAAGFTQDVVLTALGARWQLTDWRIKTNTACTGATTALSGLGTTGNNTLFRSQTYDIAPAAANTNLSTGPTAGAGADTAAGTNLVASLITTVQNVDQLVAGCAVDYWAMWGILP